MDAHPYSFDPFTITDAIYNEVDGHRIGLSILTPKTIKPGKRPVIVRFHGGFLITGARNFAPFFPQWLGEWILKNGFILINADYRLLPEATGKDILADISIFWSWTRNSLDATIAHLGVSADLSQLITFGESAGGWCAVQAALLHPEMGVKAVVSQYGVLDIKTPHFTVEYEKIILGMPMVGRDIFERHMRELEDGKLARVVSSCDPPERLDLSLSIVQYGRYAKVLGAETELYPMENLDRVDGLPTMWLLHGTGDTAVPVEGSKAFAAKAKQLHPQAEILLTLQPGEHGFDGHESSKTSWIAEGIAFIEKAWLA